MVSGESVSGCVGKKGLFAPFFMLVSPDVGPVGRV